MSRKKRSSKGQSRPPKHGGLTDHFHHLTQLSQHRPLTLHMIVNELGFRSQSLIVFVLSLLFVFPVTIPGISLLVGPIIMLIGIGIVSRRPPWIPAKLMNHAFNPKATKNFLQRATR